MSYMQKFKYAFTKSVPVMCGYIFLGIAFGIVLNEAGYNAVWAFFISLFVYAGSMQFVMVPLMAAMTSPVTMAATTLFVNSRHMFYGISFVEAFRKMRSKWYMIYSLTDETYSVLCACKNEDPEEKNRPAWPLIALLNHSYWILGSVLGALLGQVIPFDFTGIDFAMTALFVVILMNQIMSAPKKNWRAGLIGIVAAVLCLLIFGVDNFLLPALLITVFGVGVTAKTEKQESDENSAEPERSGSYGD